MDLAGKNALITGAARRLGRATALALANDGVRIVVHYKASKQGAEDLVAQIRRGGREAWSLCADLENPREAESLLGRAGNLAGPIQILVNNAAVFPRSTLRNFSLEELNRAIGVNAFAPLLIGRAFAAQGVPGHIINFLDSRIADYDAAHVPYQLSKGMLFTLTRMMALEFAPQIQVNAVAPGLILPPEGKDESYLQSLAHTNPLNRVGSAEEVAAAVLFLLRSDFITGQVIFVDGGGHMRGALHD